MKQDKGSDIKTFLLQHPRIFQRFLERDDLLDTVTRYRNYQKKFFPTTLKSHQHQVAAMVAWFIITYPEIMSCYGIDSNKLIIMAWVHDDLEVDMKFGDVPSASEAKRKQEESDEISRDERQAIVSMARRFPKYVGDYVYEEILLDAGHALVSRESQLVKFLDKMTGFGEALHEMRFGNETFFTAPSDVLFGTINHTPMQYYSEFLQKIELKLPLFYEMIDSEGIPLLEIPQEEVKFSDTHYMIWKEAIQVYAPKWEWGRLFSEK